jgi:copper chaperone CopZ
VDPVPGRGTEEERRRATVQHMAIAGMGCPNCANRIRNALTATRGLVDVDVDLPGALATVWYRPEGVGVADVTRTIEAAGEGTHHRYLGVPVPRASRG